MTSHPKKKRHYLDYSILVPYLILSLLGLVMVYSSTSYLQFMPQTKGVGPETYLKNQSIYFFLSLILMGILYKVKIAVFKNKTIIQILICSMAVLLLLTRFSPLGVEINGAKGWLRLFGLSFQPAEYLKLLIIWYMAYILSKRQKSITNDFLHTVSAPFYTVMGLIGLVAIQPDVGGAAILTLLFIAMLISSGVSYKIGVAIGSILITISLVLMQGIALFGQHIPIIKTYIYDRFAMFKNPFIDPLEKGHQLVNSYYAIHNGGWFGLGLGNSIQKKGFLPEAHTDFIFSIVIEELGIVGALVILFLLFFMIYRILKIATKTTDTFRSLWLIGIASLFLIQTFVNLGGVLGIIPMTGVTFPFLSQGGNSLLMLSTAVAIALNLSAEEKREKETLQYEQ